MPEDFADEVVALPVAERTTLHTGRIATFVREFFDYNGVQLDREFFEHPGAVAVIALDDEDRVLTIHQYRHPLRTRAWEIPAGLLDVAGESQLLAAQRELAEEADVVASDWKVLLDLDTSPGLTNERVRVFLARGLSATETAHDREAEEADIEVRWMPLDDIIAAASDGSIRNAILISGAFAAAHARDRNWDNLRDALASKHP